MTWPAPGSDEPFRPPARGVPNGDHDPYGLPAAHASRPPWEDPPPAAGFPAGPGYYSSEPPTQAYPPGQGYPPGPGSAAGHGFPGQTAQRPAMAGQATHGQATAGQAAHAAQPGSPAARVARAPGRRVAAGLALLALLTTLGGLFLADNGVTIWHSSPDWAAFALVCALVQLTPAARSLIGWPAARAWTFGAIGTGGLLFFWVLIVLPVISSNASFMLTIGAAAAAGSSWLAPGRRI